MQFLKRLFGRNDEPVPGVPPVPAAPAVPVADPQLAVGAQRKIRANMEAEVAQDRAKRGIVDPAPPTDK